MDEKRLNKQQNYSIKFTLVNSFWKHSIFNDGEQKKKQKKIANPLQLVTNASLLECQY